MSERSYTDAEVDAAIAALSGSEALRGAEDLVARAAPQLQRILDRSLAEGGWFGGAHEQALREAVGAEPGERERLVRSLLAEETRLGMLVGVAVGFGLARELDLTPTPREG